MSALKIIRNSLHVAAQLNAKKRSLKIWLIRIDASGRCEQRVDDRMHEAVFIEWILFLNHREHSPVRKIYLVTYDIADDKRLRKVFKTMRNWGDHLQYSVFECQLNPTELLRLKAELSQLINNAQDQVLFVDLGPAAGRAQKVIEALGQPYVTIASPCLII
jgi:CRISPR-associated protein Cas2